MPEFTGRRHIVAVPDLTNPTQLINVVPPTDETFEVGGAHYARNSLHNLTVLHEKKKDITFRDLLSHRSGLPAWVRLMSEKDADAARTAVLNLSLAYPPRTRVIYSCMNFLLLAMSAERITGQTLEQLIKDRVFSVLGLQATMFLPLTKGITLASIAPTEVCTTRGMRMHGEVHDENAYRLGGVAGNAGLFGSVRDMSVLGMALLNGGSVKRADGTEARLLSKETLKEMCTLQASFENIARGLAFVLWSEDPDLSGYALSHSAFGHTVRCVIE